MKRIFESHIVTTGLAMFSMFFGSGNLIFPLVIGKIAGDKNVYSITGLLITAVGIPFLGLAAMILFNGDYKKFLYRIGEIPGFILMTIIMCLIGPFGVLPRCIVLSYAATYQYLPGMSLLLFSAISAGIIFLLTVKESKILDVLGKYLSPILLLCLGIIIIKGLIYAPKCSINKLSGSYLFFEGLLEGYKTFDLFASIFFSSIVLSTLKKTLNSSLNTSSKKIGFALFKSGLIGAGLLSMVYIGMSFVSARYSAILFNVPDHELLISIAKHLLGSSAGLIVGLAVALACLTTAMALAVVSAEFLEKEIFLGKIKYEICLAIALLISIPVSSLQFDGLMRLLVPALKITYPAVIVLVIFNIFNKLFGLKLVKVPFYLTLTATFLFEFANMFWSL